MATATNKAATVNSVKKNVDQNSLQELLSLSFLLIDRALKSIQEAETSNHDSFHDLSSQLDRLSSLLRSTTRLSLSTPFFYDRPLCRISSDVTKTLLRATSLIRKYRHSNHLLCHLCSITTTTDFRKLSSLLDSSICDLNWFLSILDFEFDSWSYLSLPPIASSNPVLAWIWFYIATLQMGPIRERSEAANELASLARDNDWNKKMIVEEGGIVPLLRLLKEGVTSDSQVAAGNALYYLASDQERVRLIVDALGVLTIVGVLLDGAVEVQIVVAKLVRRMSEFDSFAQEEFVRQRVIKPLLLVLSEGLDLDVVVMSRGGKLSIHAIVLMNMELHGKSFKANNYGSSSQFDESHLWSLLNHRKEKEKEKESPELMLKLKVSCIEALRSLAKGSWANCKKIAEMRSLLCLAKIMEKETGELQSSCLMTVNEITAVAESNTNLRHAAFKMNSPAAKAVLEQLLRVVQGENVATLQIPAIRSMGHLARTFPARETRIIQPLVTQLSNHDIDVATEAAITLGKFANPDNYNHSEHSKTIIEFKGVPPLMKLLRTGEQSRIHGLILLCYLALGVGNCVALEQARTLTVLEGAARSIRTHHPWLRNLFVAAINQLNLYQAGTHQHEQSFAPKQFSSGYKWK